MGKMRRIIYIFSVILCGCAPSSVLPPDFVSVPVDGGEFTLMTYQRISDTVSPIRIYIEGDGNSFDAWGVPTSNPTPRGTFLRDMALRDMSPNVVYMGRPCQYIKTPTCAKKHWTTDRFSADIIDSVSVAIKDIAGFRPVILIGYSGGAMISGLVINRNPEINVIHWVTIAGVLNHSEWTGHFGDMPLTGSLELSVLPDVPQTHYIAAQDNIVPRTLSYRWLGKENVHVVPNSTHNNFPYFRIEI